MEQNPLTDAELDAIMGRIQKLMALRDAPSASVGEVANAAVLVQRLLAQYNLTLHEIESRKQPSKHSSEYGQTTVDLGSSSGYRTQWRGSLFNSICRTNWCRCVFYQSVRGTSTTKRQNARVAVVGKEHNTRVVIEMYQWLSGELNRIRIQHWQRYRREGGPESEDHRFAYSFLTAAVEQIYVRLLEEKRKQEQEVGQSMTALVIRSDQELAEALAQFFPALRQTKSVRRSINLEAWTEGQQVGRNIQLRPPRRLPEGQRGLSS